MTLLSLFTGCGGGGDPESEPQEISASVPAEIKPPQTKNLVAPDDFEYLTMTPVELNVESRSALDGRSFISVYSEYVRNQNNDWVPDFDSRLLIANFSPGKVKQQLMLSANTERVLIQIWSLGEQIELVEHEALVENNSIVWAF